LATICFLDAVIAFLKITQKAEDASNSNDDSNNDGEEMVEDMDHTGPALKAESVQKRINTGCDGLVRSFANGTKGVNVCSVG